MRRNERAFQPVRKASAFANAFQADPAEASPWQTHIDSSSVMAAQRVQLNGVFDHSVQKKSDGKDLEEEEGPASQLKAAAVQRRENKTGLPDNLKSGAENLSGMDLSSVRVRYNSPKPAQLNSLAYAQGTDIHVGPGQEKHLPHETWHVTQQLQGRVQPTTSIGGAPVNDSPSLEKEADVMGSRAMKG